MGYQALYRTYRPQSFNEVVGQEVVVKTLQNAILNNKISHAYLFSGPRGTGKTTVARIFAKALNCTNLVGSEPCGACDSCKEISEGVSVDVIEVDAASNSGVDEIRQIRDKAKFLPSGVKYKVYIIDEVHMLTTASFNALLKTLEEPPMHVVFILATTEPQRIPLTILSRCQRFEFKALTNSEIEGQLNKVCQDLAISITDEALTQIAEGSEGALRDALSTLDQAISYSNGVIDVEEVNVVLGSLSTNKLIELGSSCHRGDIANTLDVVHDLLEKGKEADKIISGLLRFYHDMLLYKNVKGSHYNKFIFEKPEFQELANNTSEDLIYYYVEVLSEAQNKIKYSASPNLYLEVALIKLVNSSDMSLNYLQRINDLEKQVANMDCPEGVQAVGLSGEDVERISITEDKVNRVISELSKYDFGKLYERILTLETKASMDTPAIDTSFMASLDSIKEDVAVLKANMQTIKNVPNESAVEFDSSELEEKISKLEQKLNALPRVDIAQINEDSVLIEELEKRVQALEETPVKEVIVEKVIETVKETSAVEEEKELNNSEASNDVAPVEEPSSALIDVEKQECSPIIVEQQSLETHNEEVLEETEPEEYIEEQENKETNQQNLFDFAQENEPLEVKESALQLNEESTIDDVVEIQENNNDIEAEVSVSAEDEPKQKSLFDFDENEINPSHEEERNSLVNNSIDDLKSSESKAMDTPIAEDKAFVRNAASTVTPIDKYYSYDIRFVSEILRDSRNESALNDLRRLKNTWDVLINYPKPEYQGTISVLIKGKIVACGIKEFIVEYSSATACNQVMAPTFKKSAMEVLKVYLGDEFNYIALPSKVWNEKRISYIQQYNEDKTREPVLTPIDDPDLFIIMPNQEYKDPNDAVVENLRNMFGDKVKVR